MHKRTLSKRMLVDAPALAVVATAFYGITRRPTWPERRLRPVASEVDTEEAQGRSDWAAGRSGGRRHAELVDRPGGGWGGLSRPAHRLSSSPRHTPISLHPITLDQPATRERLPVRAWTALSAPTAGSVAPSAVASACSLLARLAHGENERLHAHVLSSTAPVGTPSPST
jgi:hypothetical protein